MKCSVYGLDSREFDEHRRLFRVRLLEVDY